MSANQPNIADDQLQQVDTACDQFIQRLGARVFEARKCRKMSRRILSERSGVSQRTIVLLETGKGNISVALLFRVADALNLDLGGLVADGEFELSNRLITRFNEADKSVQEQVLSLLLPEKLGAKKRQRVCLIGLRGAGKSTLGRLLSDSLALPFVELNREIESLCGMSVAELMSLYGQEGYRRLEFQAIEKLVDSEGPLVFAAAGGIVSESDTYQLLLENFYTVWLKAAPEVHMARVIRQGDTRLAAGTNPEAMAQLRSILTSREELYAAADFMIDTTDSSIDEVLQELLLVVRQVQSQSA